MGDAQSGGSGKRPSDPALATQSQNQSQHLEARFGAAQHGSLTRPLPQLQLEHAHIHYGNPVARNPDTGYFAMETLASALPDYGAPLSAPGPYPHMQHFQRQDHPGLSGASTSAFLYQVQQNLQYPGHIPTATAYGALPQFGHHLAQDHLHRSFFQGQGSHMADFSAHPGHMSGFGRANSVAYPAFHGGHQVYHYPGVHPAPEHFAAQYSLPAEYQGTMFGRRSSAPPLRRHPTVAAAGMAGVGSFHAAHLAFGVPLVGDHGTRSSPDSYGWHGMIRHASDSNLVNVPRGPPRKPKQSGHALWVGNLPPGTSIVDLKDHFSRDSAKDILSVFLISKSNCAFVNYKTEAACAAAMHRFHESRFQGVRLVCRLRRSATHSASAAAGQPPASAPVTASASPQPSDEQTEESESGKEQQAPEADGECQVERRNVTDRYFIVKSLTVHDLELSVRSGTWATQSHNERRFDVAYESAENVYLIFSANKSGEYFGYARMEGPILHGGEESRDPRQVQLNTPGGEAPKSIATAATETAPTGRIIDDSARGTIFWEADRADSDEETEGGSGPEKDAPVTWGRPFRLEWLSTARLPFYRTRGLRNPWNANREVKIARDGTELEPSVGRRLVQMFGQAGLTALPVGPGGAGGGQVGERQEASSDAGPAGLRFG